MRKQLDVKPYVNIYFFSFTTRWRNMMRFKLTFLCLMLLAALTANVQGATVVWVGNDTDFGIGYNWSSNSFPGVGDTAIMNNGLPTHNTDGRLWLHDPSFTPPDDFDTPPGIMGTLYVGSNGLTGTIDQQTYTLEAQNNVIIGDGEAAAGVAGGTGNLYLSGDAIFKHTTAGDLALGRPSGAATSAVTTGNIVMSGNAELDNTAGILYIGGGTGGSWMNPNGVNGVGSITMSGNAVLNQTNGSDTRIGQNGGVGTFTMNGNATANFTGWVCVGYGSDQSTNAAGVSLGTLTINGGTFTKLGGGDLISGGQASNGVINQNGGTVNLEWCLKVGEWGNSPTYVTGGAPKPPEVLSHGEYHLNGGVLKVTMIGSNWWGKGDFYFNGGTLTPGMHEAENDGWRSPGQFMYNNNSGDNTILNFWVQAGGAKIDTAGQDVWSNCGLLDGGGGGFVKSGLGAFKMNAVCTYTGPTDVMEGTLGGSGSFASSSLVTVHSGAGIAPGDPASLTVGNITFNDGSYLDITLAGALHDVLNSTGTLTVGSNVALNVLLSGTPVPGDYDILNWLAKSGDFVPNLPDMSPYGDGTWTISYDKDTGVLTVVPEPATIVLLLTGALMLYWHRRR